MPRHSWCSALLLLAAFACCQGCVRREMTITSDPPGAQVLVNQTWKGKTPFTLRFKHYGVYDILLTAPGYYPLHVAEPVRGPGYEKFGVDFVSEVMVPKRIQDKRELHYKLEKIAKEDKIDDILARDGKLRDKSNRIAEARETRDKNRRHLTLPLRTKEQERKREREKKKGRARAAGHARENKPAAPSSRQASGRNSATGAKPSGDKPSGQGQPAAKKREKAATAPAPKPAAEPELDNP